MGVLYYFLRVRSPAPPLVALVGLLGMLAGEQLIPVAQAALTRVAPLIDRHRHRSPSPLTPPRPPTPETDACATQKSPQT